MFKFNAFEHRAAFPEIHSVFADGVNAAEHPAYEEACSPGEGRRIERQTQGVNCLRSSIVQ